MCTTAAELLHCAELVSELSGDTRRGCASREKQDEYQVSRFSDVFLTLYSDSSAARSLTARLGVQRTRHVTNRILWLQQVAHDKVLHIRRVRTEQNPADIFTKPVSRTPEKLLPYLT